MNYQLNNRFPYIKYPYSNYCLKLGMTNHPGGITSTIKMLEKCNINNDYHLLILVVSWYNCLSIAIEHGCRVVGIDI